MGFFSKIKEGLKKTRDNVVGQIDSMLKSFTKIDDELFEELEELLVMGDVGMSTASKICDQLKEKVKKDGITDPKVIRWMLEDITAEMLAGGEDPKFIARRLVILAAEDIGLANPNGLLLANTCFDTVHKIGMPEARIPLAEATIYLATSPKSNSAYMAIDTAMGLVNKDTANRPVPLHIRNAPTKLMKNLGYGDNYKYAHNYEGNFVDQEFMPKGLEGYRFYEPGNNNKEKEIAQRIQNLWKGKY